MLDPPGPADADRISRFADAISKASKGREADNVLIASIPTRGAQFRAWKPAVCSEVVAASGKGQVVFSTDLSSTSGVVGLHFGWWPFPRASSDTHRHSPC